jgi:hypothetical protein
MAESIANGTMATALQAYVDNKIRRSYVSESDVSRVTRLGGAISELDKEFEWCNRRSRTAIQVLSSSSARMV